MTRLRSPQRSIEPGVTQLRWRNESDAKTPRTPINLQINRFNVSGIQRFNDLMILTGGAYAAE